MSKIAIPPECKILLLCEGRSDVDFFKALTRHMFGKKGNLEAVNVERMGGKPGLRASIDAVKQEIPRCPDFRALGIVLDADHAKAPAEGSESIPEDTPAQRTLDLINEELRGVFGESEKLLGHMDIEPLTEEISVGVFVMSGDGESGELEDLLLKAAGDKHPEIMKCVKEFRACAELVAKDRTKKEAKQAVQTLISGLRGYCRDFESALNWGMVDFDNAAFDELRDFLRKLAVA